MSRINTFLQKRKIREKRYSFGMVFTAYVLSIIMLFFGSDSFYNIRSTAAGVSTEEEAEQKAIHETVSEKSERISRRGEIIQSYRAALINPYGVENMIQTEEKNATGLQRNNNVVNLVKDVEESNGTPYNENFDEGQIKKEEPTTPENKEKAAKQDEGKDETKRKHKKKQTKAANKASIESFSVNTKGSSQGIDITKEEVKMLQRIVEAEASGEDVKGKILIANVVINRMEDEEFPNSIERVIFQKTGGDYQFSPIADKRYWSVKVSKDTREAVSRAIRGEDYSKGALYFMARRRASGSGTKWFDNNLDWLFKHGRHEFYK